MNKQKLVNLILQTSLKISLTNNEIFYILLQKEDFG